MVFAYCDNLKFWQLLLNRSGSFARLTEILCHSERIPIATLTLTC